MFDHQIARMDYRTSPEYSAPARGCSLQSPCRTGNAPAPIYVLYQPLLGCARVSFSIICGEASSLLIGYSEIVYPKRVATLRRLSRRISDSMVVVIAQADC